MTVATLFSANMALLTGNTGGAIQSLPGANTLGGKSRSFIASLVLAAQASGAVIGMARIPLIASLMGISVSTDTSLGSATIEFGDVNSPALFAAAQTLTSINTPTGLGKTDALCTPLLSGYDCTTGNLVTPQAPGEGGALYEDIVMTVGAAALPATGLLVVVFDYMID